MATENKLNIEVGDKVILKTGLQDDEYHFGARLTYYHDFKKAARRHKVDSVDLRDGTIRIDGWWIPFEYIEKTIKPTKRITL